MTDCPFCQKIAAGGDSYGPVHDTAMAFVKRFAPLNPVASGHTLFVPVAHYERADDGSHATADAFDAAIRYAEKEGLGAYNLIQSNGTSATQTVPHVHVHLVPRLEGDGLALPWTDQQKEPR